MIHLRVKGSEINLFDISYPWINKLVSLERYGTRLLQLSSSESYNYVSYVIMNHNFFFAEIHYFSYWCLI